MKFTVFTLLAAIVACTTNAQSTKPNIRGELLAQWDRQLRRKTEAMLEPNANFDIKTLWTVGETTDDGYTPPGIFDGMGAYALDDDTVRLLVNHELSHTRGYPYSMMNGLTLTGARVSYFDIDKKSMKVTDSGMAYDKLYDVDGNIATALTDLFPESYQGLSRFCSGRLVVPGQFESGSGLVDLIYFAPEETSARVEDQNGAIAGHIWALDVHGNALWDIGAMGRGAWENLAPVDTGNPATVGFILADDTSPVRVGM